MSQQNFLPAPIQTRHDGWTPERQWRFIEVLAATASIGQAARAAGMSVRAAQRLRRHPMAATFREAWDSALAQAWGQVEQVALDRAINGETEVIEREGMIVAERHRPCSDRLMIFLLGARERALAAERAERAAAHERAMAAARIAAIGARAGGSRRKGTAAPAAAPEPLSDAAAETLALQAFRAQALALTAWPAMEDGDAPFDIDKDGQIPLSPASSRMSHAASAAKPPEPTHVALDRFIQWSDYRAPVDDTGR